MKKMLIAISNVSLLVSLSLNVYAMEVAGVTVDPSVTVNNQTLKLNGSGLRKKFFIKVYVGSLYAVKHLSSPNEVLNDTGDKLIRMKFIHSKVGKDKIIEAFADGFANNAPDVAGSDEMKRFLSFFVEDFMERDTVDIALGADGTVTVRHNGKMLGTIKSGKLAHGILSPSISDRIRQMRGLRVECSENNPGPGRKLPEQAPFFNIINFM